MMNIYRRTAEGLVKGSFLVVFFDTYDTPRFLQCFPFTSYRGDFDMECTVPAVGSSEFSEPERGLLHRS